MGEELAKERKGRGNRALVYVQQTVSKGLLYRHNLILDANVSDFPKVRRNQQTAFGTL